MEENRNSNHKIFSYKNLLQQKKTEGLNSLRKKLYAENDELKNQNSALEQEILSFQRRKELNSKETDFDPNYAVKIFNTLDQLSNTTIQKKAESQRILIDLMNKDQNLSLLENKLPFIFDCMGNTLFGSKHLEASSLKSKVSDREKELVDLDVFLDILEGESKQTDFLNEYDKLSREIQDIRIENEDIRNELVAIQNRFKSKQQT